MRGSLYLDAAGFVAPGIGSLAELGAHLDGAPHARPVDWAPVPETMPRRQALRLSTSIRIAVMAAEQVAAAVRLDAAWVFASSVGEGETLHVILDALCQPEVMIQPLRFQNAVHNSAQGQWSIIAGAAGAATSIAAYDETVGAGLLKVMMQTALEETDAGLVIYDAPLPGPLHVKRPFAMPMAAAFALSRAPGAASLCRLELEFLPEAVPTDPAGAGVAAELTESGNPVRFVLPLLARIHWLDSTPLLLGLPGGGGLEVTVHEVSGAD